MCLIIFFKDKKKVISLFDFIKLIERKKINIFLKTKKNELLKQK